MNWVIDKNSRCEMLVYENTGLAGGKNRVQIFPSGRQGDIKIAFSSIVFAGPIGTRIVLCASPIELGWQERSWRACIIQKGSCFKLKDGRLAFRIPNLENLDEGNAVRSDPDFECSYDYAEGLDASTAWSYGRPGDLNGRVGMIRIDRVDLA
jgi:hypothetical protein